MWHPRGVRSDEFRYHRARPSLHRSGDAAFAASPSRQMSGRGAILRARARRRALSRRGTGSLPGAGRGPATAVAAAEIVRGDFPVVFTGLGTITALATSVVKAQVSGSLVHVRYTEGEMVKAGDVLAEIDPRPFELAVAHPPSPSRESACMRCSNCRKAPADRARGLLCERSTTPPPRKVCCPAAAAGIAGLAEAKRLHLRPLGVRQYKSVHPSLES